MKFAKPLSSALIASLLLPLPLIASMYTGCASYIHPRIASGQLTIHSACFMPAEGKLQKIGLKRPEVMANESSSFSETLQGVIQAHLKTAGLGLSVAESSDDSSPDPSLQQKLLDLQQKFDALNPQLHKHPKDIAKSAYTLGPEVAQLPCASRSDVLVFVRAEGQVVTGDRAALGAIFNAGPRDDTANVYVTFADAKSGDIVALFNISHVYLRGIQNDPDKVYGGALDKELPKLKLGAFPGKPA